MMKKFVWIVSLMTIICAAYAQVFTWTDSQGVVHFSDNPHPGAEKLTIPDTQTFSPPTSTPRNQVTPQNQDDSDDKEVQYTKIVITQPLNQSTIRNNQGSVTVAIELDPPKLGSGDKLQMIFDGTPLGEPQSSNSFELKGIDRGSHTITVKIVNGEGTELLSSDGITIYMQRPRVGMVHGN